MLVQTIDSGCYDSAAFIGYRHVNALIVHHNGDDETTWDGSNDWDERVPEKWILTLQGGKEVEVTEEVFDKVRSQLSR